MLSVGEANPPGYQRGEDQYSENGGDEADREVSFADPVAVAVTAVPVGVENSSVVSPHALADQVVPILESVSNPR